MTDRYGSLASAPDMVNDHIMHFDAEDTTLNVFLDSYIHIRSGEGDIP